MPREFFTVWCRKLPMLLARSFHFAARVAVHHGEIFIVELNNVHTFANTIHANPIFHDAVSYLVQCIFILYQNLVWGSRYELLPKSAVGI